MDEKNSISTVLPSHLFICQVHKKEKKKHLWIKKVGYFLVCCAVSIMILSLRILYWPTDLARLLFSSVFNIQLPAASAPLSNPPLLPVGWTTSGWPSCSGQLCSYSPSSLICRQPWKKFTSQCLWITSPPSTARKEKAGGQRVTPGS